jgi:hypothetical protein
MMNLIRLHRASLKGLAAALLISSVACDRNDPNDPNTVIDSTVLLVIDEESIDNGNEPNNFSETEVNDQLATVGLRLPLQFFRDNVGETIDLYTGEVGDEGWHALKTIPAAWVNAGPISNGSRNFLSAGTGEDLLDKVPDVVPLRATGLKMLIGKTVLAVVYDSDISTNYSPLFASLMGANLGTVAFDVVAVTERTDASSSSLPRVTILIRNVDDALIAPLMLFANVPIPQSSSEPFDIKPPNNTLAPVLVDAP